MTSSGGHPTEYTDKDGYKCWKWNSGGFAPAWIEIQFFQQPIKELWLVPNMTPNSGLVAYSIAIDGAAHCNLNETLTCGVKRIIKIGKNCSRIRVTTTSSPSWVAWFDIYALSMD
jgi:hypothetical protein